ncbi:MAG: glycoside hydrolase family 127 protein [Candidatus Heimdallarchaeota archaeon]|nr:MAG: glycoside hydrolase family 127 protein [Candidatus Heimdallarchaeota archaeon]
MVCLSNQLTLKQVQINDSFWNSRLKMNIEDAIFHQWKQLEKYRCIDNFRILIGDKEEGFREGWFFSDSDAYKWLDAACRIYTIFPSNKLKGLIDEFIKIIQRSEDDGYIYTFNQIHFPDKQWTNLWIEHELYCLGHLIEALLAHYEFSLELKILELAIRIADLLVQQFLEENTSSNAIPGHQEIEIALIKLFRITNRTRYLKLAEEFLQRRGKSRLKWLSLLKQDFKHNRRLGRVKRLKEKYLIQHPEDKDFRLPDNVYITFPSGFKRRVFFNYVTGKYFQIHNPLENQTIPEGHAVRFSYLMTAAAMYSYETDKKYLPNLQTVWNHMVSKKMFVTGGIGSLPGIEGFGRDYELNPEYAYCETCGALGSIFWNWEMTLLTAEAKFADLLEWQLYNAVSVGISQDGKSYLYRNPLVSKGDVTRKEWFAIPCCPSNLSRTWASLGQYIYSYHGSKIWIHQYIGNETHFTLESMSPMRMILNSGFPWHGNVQIELDLISSEFFAIYLRIPSWVESYSLKINDEDQQVSRNELNTVKTASGYSPFRSCYISLEREWNPGDRIDLHFPMKIQILQSRPEVKNDFGKSTITRGPVVYCLENIDNPNIDIFNARIFGNSLTVEPTELFGDIYIIKGQTEDGKKVAFIPYYCWSNREHSQMTVMVNVI